MVTQCYAHFVCGSLHAYVTGCVCVCLCVFSSSHAMQRLTFLTDTIQSIIFTHKMGHNLGVQHDDGSKSPLGPG